MIAAALLLASVSVAPSRTEALRRGEERYSLAYRAKAGETTDATVHAVYKTGGPQIDTRYEIRSEVLSVERDGTYTARSVIGTKIYQVAGKSEIRNEGEIEWEAKYNVRGEMLPDEESDDAEEDDPVNDLMRLAVGYEPKTPVALGESWTPPMDERLNLYPLKYTLVGSGPFEGKTELMLEGKGPGRDGTNVDVKVWVDAATFIRRKGIVKITEVPTRTGNDGEILVTIEQKIVSRG